MVLTFEGYMMEVLPETMEVTTDMETVGNQEGSVLDGMKEDEMDNMNFEKITDVDGKDKFKCKVCENEANTEGGMKRHITTKHLKPKETKDTKKRERGDDETENIEDKKAKVEEAEDDPDDMGLVERILAGNAYGSSQSNPELGDKTLADLDNTMTEVKSQEGKLPEVKSQEESLTEANSKLSKAEEELITMKTNSEEDKAKIASLEEALQTMKQMVDLTKATNNSLEIESYNKDVKIEKIQLAVKMQDTVIRKMQEDAKKKVNLANEHTLKTLREENKAQKKRG